MKVIVLCCAPPSTSLGDSSPNFATEITLCPAKLSCSNDACILEIQFHSASIHSILHPTLPLLCGWPQGWVCHSSVAERSHSEQSTCYGPLWHHSGYHPLEGVAWSQLGYPRGNVIVPCGAPFTCCLGIHLQKLSVEITDSPCVLLSVGRNPQNFGPKK